MFPFQNSIEQTPRHFPDYEAKGIFYFFNNDQTNPCWRKYAYDLCGCVCCERSTGGKAALLIDVLQRTRPLARQANAGEVEHGATMEHLANRPFGRPIFARNRLPRRLFRRLSRHHTFLGTLLAQTIVALGFISHFIFLSSFSLGLTAASLEDSYSHR